MNTLSFYLWKEWRQHRVALLAVALICTVMMTGFAWLLATQRVLRAPLFPSVSGVVAVLIAMLAVGGELLAERRAGGLAWLERLPAGLATPFWAKLAFHLPVAAAAGLFGFGLAFVAAWMRGAAPEGIQRFFGYELLFLGVLFALWTFATSSWSSRSVLALFGAGFVLAGLGMPIWYLNREGYRFEPWELVTGILLLLTGWLPSAWLGFVTAGRFGRGPGLGGVLGFAAAVASFLPFWGWGLWQLHLRDRFDPRFEGFEIRSARVTDDERTAFVEAWIWSERWEAEALPHYVLRVSLEDGSFERIQSGSMAMIPVRTYTADCQQENSVEVYDREAADQGIAFDLATGAATGVKEVGKQRMRCPKLRGWLEAWQPFRTDTALTDAFTGKTLYPAELALPRDASLYGDLGRWYAISRREGAFLVDPDSKAVTRAEWLDVVDQDFGPRLADGRFFAPLREGGVGLVDPHRSVVTSVVGGKRVEGVYRACELGSLPFAEDEVVLLRTSEGTYRFDATAETLELVPFLSHNRPVGCARDGSVFVLVHGSLVRFDIDSREMTWLFPRAR